MAAKKKAGSPATSTDGGQAAGWQRLAKPISLGIVPLVAIGGFYWMQIEKKKIDGKKVEETPCAVQCIESVLKEKQKNVEKSIIDAAAGALSKGAVKLQADDTNDVTYRAISDETVRYAIGQCTQTCNVKPVSLELDYETTVHVTALSSGGQPRDLPGATVNIGNARPCTTGSDGRCPPMRLTGLDLKDEVEINVKSPDGSLSKPIPKKLPEIVKKEVLVEMGPLVELVSVTVMTKCGAERLSNAVVSAKADGADVWKEGCGSSYPSTPADQARCAEETLLNGVAKFYVSGKPTKFRLSVKPSSDQPVSYELDPSTSPFVLDYPKKCEPPPPPPPATPQVACPELQAWVQARVKPAPGAPSTLVPVSIAGGSVSCAGCPSLAAPPANLVKNCKPFSVRVAAP